MIKTLAIKELRETAWIGLVGLAVYLLMVASLTVNSTSRTLPQASGAYLPFLGPNLIGLYFYASLALVLALGFRQSVGETMGGTFGLLLHRPLDRRRVLLTKIAVGVGLFLIVGAVPLLLYGCWAATPGTHASPFMWSMTINVWKVWIAMPLLYLGAFLSGLRPGRWWATRLLPLVASGSVTLLTVVLPWWPISGLPILLGSSLIAVAGILWVGTVRDYS